MTYDLYTEIEEMFVIDLDKIIEIYNKYERLDIEESIIEYVENYLENRYYHLFMINERENLEKVKNGLLICLLEEL